MEEESNIRTVYSLTPLNQSLRDKRLKTHGHKFGQVGKLAQQYGVQVTIVDPPPRMTKRAKKFKKQLKICYAFSAPRARLQKLVEKFHFSLTKYAKQPYFR